MSRSETQEATPLVLHEIERALREIQFGSVEITLHEGRVTQIERREKVRLAVHRQESPSRPVRAA